MLVFPIFFCIFIKFLPPDFYFLNSGFPGVQIICGLESGTFQTQYLKRAYDITKLFYIKTLLCELIFWDGAEFVAYVKA